MNKNDRLNVRPRGENEKAWYPAFCDVRLTLFSDDKNSAGVVCTSNRVLLKRRVKYDRTQHDLPYGFRGRVALVGLLSSE